MPLLFSINRVYRQATIGMKITGIQNKLSKQSNVFTENVRVLVDSRLDLEYYENNTFGRDEQKTMRALLVSIKIAELRN